MLVYDSKLSKHPGKLQMHCLGRYIINFITKGGEVQLQELSGAMFPKLVNGSRLKPCRMGPVLRDA